MALTGAPAPIYQAAWNRVSAAHRELIEQLADASGPETEAERSEAVLIVTRMLDALPVAALKIALFVTLARPMGHDEHQDLWRALHAYVDRRQP